MANGDDDQPVLVWSCLCLGKPSPAPQVSGAECRWECGSPLSVLLTHSRVCGDIHWLVFCFSCSLSCPFSYFPFAFLKICVHCWSLLEKPSDMIFVCKGPQGTKRPHWLSTSGLTPPLMVIQDPISAQLSIRESIRDELQQCKTYLIESLIENCHISFLIIHRFT